MEEKDYTDMITGMSFKGMDEQQLEQGTLYRYGYETHNRACFGWALAKDDTIIECDTYSTSRYKRSQAQDYGLALLDKLEAKGISEPPGPYDHLDDNDPHWSKPVETESKLSLQDRKDNIISILTGKGPTLNYFFDLYPAEQAEVARRREGNLDPWVQIIANDIRLLHGLGKVTDNDLDELVYTIRATVEMLVQGVKKVNL